MKLLTTLSGLLAQAAPTRHQPTAWGLGIYLLLATAAQAQGPVVTGLTPARNAAAVPRATNVAVSFSQPLSNTAGIQQALKIFSYQAGGQKAGTTTVSGNTLTFNPTTDFKPGETVSATVTTAAQSTTGTPATPHVLQFTTATTPAPGVFSGGAEITVGARPQQVVTGDVDGDGDLDLVTASAGNYSATDGTVEVSFNDGAGSFNQGQLLARNGRFSSVALADLDSDGDLDLLIGNADTNAVTILRNSGSGFFGGPQRISVGANPLHLAIGDVDADGDLDLVSTNFTYGTNAVSIRLNDGGGNFSGSQEIYTEYLAPTSAVLGDVDSDGDLDVVTANSGNSYGSTVSTYLNDGRGTFGAGQQVGVGRGPTYVVLGDMDADGDLDLATANIFDANSGPASTLSVRLNNGAGVFSGGQEIPLSYPYARGLVLGDVDGNGALDLLTANQGTPGSVSVRLNNGAGSFGGFQEVAVDPIPGYITLGDVDGDGDLDLLTANGGTGGFGNTVSVRLNQNEPLPVITSVSPTAAPAGSLVVINGSNLLSTQRISFNGVSTTDFVFNSLTQLAVRVPAGATSGPVAVTTFSGTSNSVPFLVAPFLQVTSVVPARNAVAAPRAANVAVTFSEGLSSSTSTQQALRVFSQQAGGQKAGTAIVSGNTLTFNPATDFKPGETVFATVTTSAQSSTGTPATPHVFRFTTATAPTLGIFNGGSEVVLALNKRPQDAILGDLDGDGDLDLALAITTSSGAILHTVGIRLNDGSGTFNGTQELAVNGVGLAIALSLGDVDGDGDLDLLVVNNDNNSASLFLNNGGGGFSPSPVLPTGFFGSEKPTLGDVDGDGDLDLVLLTATYNGVIVSVRLNLGNGGFASTAQQVVVGSASLEKLALGDVDQDGDVDLLLLNSTWNGTVSVYSNAGNGSFSSTQEVSVVPSPIALTLGDVDGDGDLDFIATGSNYQDNRASVQLNDGSGRFSAGQRVPIQIGARDATVGDVDGDGDLDLLVSGIGNVVSVRVNNGQGVFSGFQEVAVGTSAMPYPSHLTLGDVDGDGDLDLMTANVNGNTVSIRLNQNEPLPTITSLSPATAPVGTVIIITGTNLLTTTGVTFNGVAAAFTLTANNQLTVTVPAGATTGAVVVTTGSGISNSLPFTVAPLLLATSFSPARNAFAVPRNAPVAVSFNKALSNEAATLGALKVFSPQAGGQKAGSTTVSGNTLTFDPSTDFRPGETVWATVTAAARGGNSQNLIQPQVYQFTAATASATGVFPGGSEVAVGARSMGVAVGDVDGDGDLDLLSANSIYNGTVSVRLNDGAGNYRGSQQVSVGHNPYCVALGDVDSDGDLDLLTGNTNDDSYNTVSVRLNNGQGVFSNGQDVSGNRKVFSLALGDVDGDGDLDIVAANYYQSSATEGSVSILLNSGSGNFASSQEVRVGLHPVSVVLGDLDNDGDLDFVTTTPEGTTASVRLNNGAGVFSGTQEANVGFSPQTVVLGDVDGDGDLDLATTNYYYDYLNPGPYTGSTVNVRLNDGTGTFSGTQRMAVGQGALGAALGDVDGDGDLDLLVSNELSNTVSVRLNNSTGIFSGSQEVAVGSAPYGVAVGDLDNNGTLDFVTGNGTANTVSVRLNQETPPVGTVYRLNAGGGALPTSRGAFAADQYYSAGSRPNVTSAPITGTPDQALYQTERYSTNGQLSYALPVVNGPYSVVLHFAEIYWTQPGQRVFNIALEGNTVRTNFDIVAKVGPRAATTETYQVTVTDGVLNLDLVVPYLSGGADQAKLSALEVLPVTSGRATLATGAKASIRLGQELSVYPNPTAGHFTLTYSAAKAQAGTLTLVDQLGRTVHEQSVQLQTGANQLAVQPAPMRTGLYQLVLRTADGQRSTQKVVVQP